MLSHAGQLPGVLVTLSGALGTFGRISRGGVLGMPIKGSGPEELEAAPAVAARPGKTAAGSTR